MDALHACLIKRQAHGASTVFDKCTCVITRQASPRTDGRTGGFNSLRQMTNARARNQKASKPTDRRTGASTVCYTCTYLIKGEQAHVTQVPNDYAVILQQNGGAANLTTLDWA